MRRRPKVRKRNVNPSAKQSYTHPVRETTWFLVIDHNYGGDFRWGMTVRRPDPCAGVEVIEFVSEEPCTLFVNECLADHVEDRRRTLASENRRHHGRR